MQICLSSTCDWSRLTKVWNWINVLCSRSVSYWPIACLHAVNKKAVTYHKWCSESGPRGSPFSIPSYLYKDLDKHVLRNSSRFRLRAHHLRVESCKWHGGSSICDKCSVEKFKMRSMCFSSASVLKCASCAWDTETSLKECLRLCVCLLLRALNLFLS